MSLLESLAKGAVQRVMFRSQITPDYNYSPWETVPTPPIGTPPSTPPPPGGWPPGPPPPPTEVCGWLMNLVRPSVIVETVAGPVEISPCGEPESDLTGLAAVLGISALVGIVLGIGWIARKTDKRRRA